jgi:hypothetical protein
MRLFIHCPSGTPGPPGIGTGCGHLEWLDLADSRPAYEAMREHLSGLHGGYTYTPESVERALSGLRVYEPLKLGPDEAACYCHGDHEPHDVRGGRCYGNGPFRRVPKRETWPPTKEEN